MKPEFVPLLEVCTLHLATVYSSSSWSDLLELIHSNSISAKGCHKDGLIHNSGLRQIERDTKASLIIPEWQRSGRWINRFLSHTLP